MPIIKNIRQSPPQIIGESNAIQEVRRLIGLFSDTDDPVLILGETGTGKELVARSLHCQNTKRKDIFTVYNMASVSEELLQNEFFGHERGAFTGAHEQHLGLVEHAHDGTLFLDEINNPSLGAQAKLLRFLGEDGEFDRLGEKPFSKSSVNVRVIAATNANLEVEMANKRFRKDLYYRLAGLRIEIPPLRERKEDIPVLVQHFLKELQNKTENKTISDAAINFLMEQSWPGNIRELRNSIRRATRLAGIGEETGPEHFQHPTKNYLTEPLLPVKKFPTLRECLEKTRKSYYIELIKKYPHLNQKKIAAKGGIGYRVFRNNVKRFDLKPLLASAGSADDEDNTN